MLDIDGAVEYVKRAGVESSKQILYRWAREGRLEAAMTNKKDGYLFKEKDLQLFVEAYRPRKNPIFFPHPPSGGESARELSLLREENERLKFRISMPETYREAENLRLERLLKEKDEEIAALKEKISRASAARARK